MDRKFYHTPEESEAAYPQFSHQREETQLSTGMQEFNTEQLKVVKDFKMQPIPVPLERHFIYVQNPLLCGLNLFEQALDVEKAGYAYFLTKRFYFYSLLPMPQSTSNNYHSIGQA